MASIVLKSLSVLLGIFFIFVGTTKLTPKISKELHKELRKEFARYSKVFPLSHSLEFKISSKWYRRSVGGLEVLCGLCLTFIPSKRVKQFANLVLAFMMLFATYSHWMVGDKFERLAPSLVFFFMLTCRIIVEYQIDRKENTEDDPATKNKTKDGKEGKEEGKEGVGTGTVAKITPSSSSSSSSSSPPAVTASSSSSSSSGKAKKDV